MRAQEVEITKVLSQCCCSHAVWDISFFIPLPSFLQRTVGSRRRADPCRQEHEELRTHSPRQREAHQGALQPETKQPGPRLTANVQSHT